MLFFTWLLTSLSHIISFLNMGNIMKLKNDHNIPHLPDEVLVSILKRLPVKSLIQFQCVRKNWKNLIKSPYFIQEHLQHHTNHPTLLDYSAYQERRVSRCGMLIDPQNKQVRQIPNPPSINHSVYNMRILGSCNGLVCLLVLHNFDYDHVCTERNTDDNNLPYLLLWNPATRQSKKVPAKYIKNFNGDFCLGFGFSSVDNDYKIAKIRCYFAVNPVEVEVYSLNSGSWKAVEFEHVYLLIRTAWTRLRLLTGSS